MCIRDSLKGKGAIYRVMGNAYHAVKDLSAALSYLEQSITLLRELNQDFDLGTALYDYALVLKDASKSKEARAALTEALALFKRLELPQEQERLRAALEQLET